MRLWRDFINGIFKENPTFRLVLGTCPTMAISLTVMNGLGMGLAATAVLVGSNLIISLLRRVIPDEIRIPCFIVVIAAFVTIVDKIMHAFLPGLHEVLGIFIPLIVVNCIILARAEAFASKNPPSNSLADGFGIGFGFTVALILISSVREFLGTGAILAAKDFGFSGFRIFKEDLAAKVMTIPPGGFLTYGFLMGLINWLGGWRRVKKNG